MVPPLNQLFKPQIWKFILILLALFDHIQSKGNPWQVYCVQNMSYIPQSAMLSLIPWLKGCLSASAFVKETFPTWNWKVICWLILWNYVNVLRAQHFIQQFLTFICEPYLNQLLHWWLQNAIVFLISSFYFYSTLFYKELFFLLTSWVLVWIHGSFLNSMCYNPLLPLFFFVFKLFKIGYLFQAVFCVLLTCPHQSCKTPLLSGTTELG